MRTAHGSILSVTTRCLAVLIVRSDGTQFGLTDTAYAFSWNAPTPGLGSIAYQPIDGVDFSNIEQALDGTYDNASFTSIRDDALSRITTLDLLNNRYENARIWVYEVDWTNPGTNWMILGKYRPTKIEKFTDATYAMSVDGLRSLLRNAIGRTLLRECDAEKFGVGRCDVSGHLRSVMTFPRTVCNIPNPSSLFIVDFSGDSHASGYFSFGDLSWTGGANNGLAQDIKLHTVITPAAWSNATTYNLGDYSIGSDTHVYCSLQASNLNHDPTVSPTWWGRVTGDPANVARIVLSTPMGAAVAIGDTAGLCFGCDRRFVTCQSVANTENPSGTNIENFQGWDKILNPDYVMQVGRQA